MRELGPKIQLILRIPILSLTNMVAVNLDPCRENAIHWRDIACEGRPASNGLTDNSGFGEYRGLNK